VDFHAKRYAMSKGQICAVLFLFALTGQVLAAEGEGRKIYKWEGRPDPFLSFLSMQPPFDPPVAPPHRQGGIALEPGQLKLTAVILTETGWAAVAEDVAGKGYILRKGTFVGKYGVVRKIEGGEVVIDESFTTKSGRIVAKETVMRLKQEGEK
jgi:type IV pilus assembly protein PilP